MHACGSSASAFCSDKYCVRIKYSSAPCGSGKTRQLVNRACELVERGHKVILLQPTRELIDKTVQDELLSRSSPPLHKVFHQGVIGGSVSKALADDLQGGSDVPRIVFATHHVLPHIKHFGDKSEWHLLIDEEMQVIRYAQHRLPRTHNLITEHLAVTATDAIYGVVSQKGFGLDAIAKNSDEDEIFETLEGTARVITNAYWQTFLNLEQHQRLLRGEAISLGFHSVLRPGILDGFGDVFVASANFEDTAMYRLWAEQGVTFEPDPEFAKRLRYQQHPNGELLTIRYASERQWSKKQRTTVHGSEGETAEALLIAAAKDMFVSKPFVWFGNKSMGDVFGASAEKLPNKPHGLNSFSRIDDIVLLASLNPSSDHFRFLQARGMDGSEVRKAVYYSAAYQAVLRTSIRDPDNRQPKTILVPDYGLAGYLQNLFPGSVIQKIDIGIHDDTPKRIGRPKKHNSNRERLAQQRDKASNRKLEILNAHFRLNSQDTYEACCGDEGGESRAEMGIRLYRGFGSLLPLSACLFKSINSPTPLRYVSCETDEAFVQFLRNCHRNEWLSKGDNYLFSPAIFDPKLSTETKRGVANIVCIRNVVLDFESGDLSPEEVPLIFPGLQMIVTNTFAHSTEKPRFRVVIPASEKMTPEMYGLVYTCIAEKIEDAGYSVKRRTKNRGQAQSNTRPSGLDWSKSQPQSLFYLPCQAQNPADSFFNEFFDPPRHPITPSTWAENHSFPLQPELDVPRFENGPIDVNETVVESAIQTWRESKAHPGTGNEAFFDLAWSLRRAGMSSYQIEQTLRSEAQHGRTPKERLDQIRGILQSLRMSASVI